MELCGMPHDNNYAQDNLPLTEHVCIILDDWNQFSVELSTPYDSNFNKRILWSMVSKAFLRSKNIVPLSNAPIVSSLK